MGPSNAGYHYGPDFATHPSIETVSYKRVEMEMSSCVSTVQKCSGVGDGPFVFQLVQLCEMWTARSGDGLICLELS